MSLPTPEERASALCDAIDDSGLAPASAADRPALMAVVAEAVRKAQQDAALEMRDRCARAVDDYDIDFKSPGCCRVAAQRTAERLADAVRALDVP